MSPVTGWLLDRYPIRWLFTIGIAVQGVALYLFAHVQTPAQYVGSSLLLGLGMSGVTILPNQVLVSRWFHARVGLVNGIVLAATALGAAMAPALITRLIEALDWRTAFVIMAVVATVPPLVVVLLVVRGRPEEMGLRPYGSGAATAVPSAPLAGISLADAARLPAFWMFAGAIFLGGMPCYSFNKHILVFLKELGFDPVSAADHKSFFFFVSACARLVFGWLADRLDRRNLLLVEIVLIAGGFPILFLVPSHPQVLLPALFLFGAGYGGLLPSIPILSVHYFGRRHLGTILGAYKVVVRPRRRRRAAVHRGAVRPLRLVRGADGDLERAGVDRGRAGGVRDAAPVGGGGGKTSGLGSWGPLALGKRRQAALEGRAPARPHPRPRR